MIEIRKVSKSFKNVSVLTDISLSIETGELMVIIGKSGCGKTTLLKMINKLKNPTSGDIFIDGTPVSQLNETSLRRSIGYVVQDGGLFPHMTVEQNISIILEITRYPNEKRTDRITELLEMVHLDPQRFRHLYPCQMSGGQKQRIGVARAFAADPKYILMDEPFSALDPVTREELQDQTVELQQKYHKTIIFVTHDMDEAVKMADRICILRDGHIIQCADTEDILKHPADEYVVSFLGRDRLWGKPEYIKAADIMKTNPVCLSQERTILQALMEMNHASVSSVLVTDNGKLKGIVWLKDLQTLNVFGKAACKVKDCITTDFTTIQETTSVQDIINTVDYIHTDILPVTDSQNNLKGYLTKSILLSVLSKRYEDSGKEAAR